MVLSAALQTFEQTRLHTRRAISRFARPSAFSLPSNLPSAASRFSRNLSAFRAHYALLLWFALLASLFPTHRKAMLFLMLVSKVLLSYAVLLRVFPGSVLLRRVLDGRVVGGVFGVVVVVQILLAGAVDRVLVAGFGVGPVVVCHAVFRSVDGSGGCGDGENGTVGGEMLLQICEKKNADLESGAGLGTCDRSA